MKKKITDKLKKAIISAAEETDKAILPKIEKELHVTYKSVIREWYDNYDPLYQRHYRLYDIFDTKRTRIGIKYGFFKSNIDYGSYTDYVYDITFSEGWHGGNDRGLNHPDLGTPWYLKPGTQDGWIRQAEKSFSPREMMIERVHEYEPIWQREMRDTLMENIRRRM